MPWLIKSEPEAREPGVKVGLDPTPGLHLHQSSLPMPGDALIVFPSSPSMILRPSGSFRSALGHRNVQPVCSRVTAWEGVRNPQASKFMRESMKMGDKVYVAGASHGIH